MQIYKDWLKSNNIQFEETPIGILFHYQGGGFLIANNSNDRQYLQILMPNIYKVSPYEKTQAMEVVNKMNIEFKCLKALIQDDNSIWLSTEIFIDSTPDIKDFFSRLLSILLSGRIKFQILMQ